MNEQMNCPQFRDTGLDKGLDFYSQEAPAELCCKQESVDRSPGHVLEEKGSRRLENEWSGAAVQLVPHEGKRTDSAIFKRKEG